MDSGKKYNAPNDELPENVGCQNTAPQIQGDGNTAALAPEQAFD